jgi:L-rhamnose isomerase/sugar isomerase
MHVDQLFEWLGQLEIETPSWAFGDSGTRFHVFPWPGAARNVYERIDDAALVHQLTGSCPRVALHLPWDAVADYTALRRYAEDCGVGIGAVNPNLFQDDEYRLGSICSPDPAVRERALAHCAECISAAGELGSETISLWLADGTNYPGQDNLSERYGRLRGGLASIYALLHDGMRLLVEYKFFEPAFYSTDIPDWGTAALACRGLGERAKVLVDTGHHPQGTNIEQIVAVLLAEGLLGGFHFNNRKYADDDLIVGSIDPFELFRIMFEIANAERSTPIAFMIDQSHNVEGKIEAMLQSVSNVQSAYLKALMVDRERLTDAQHNGDVLGAHRIMLDAYETDVRPLLAEFREKRGLQPDPVEAFRAESYAERLVRERQPSTASRD